MCVTPTKSVLSVGSNDNYTIHSSLMENPLVPGRVNNGAWNDSRRYSSGGGELVKYLKRLILMIVGVVSSESPKRWSIRVWGSRCSLLLIFFVLAKCGSSQPQMVPIFSTVRLTDHSSRALTGTAGANVAPTILI